MPQSDVYSEAEGEPAATASHVATLATPPPLTVEVAAEQLQSQGRVSHHPHGLDPDVAGHDGRGEAVLLHSGAVHVSFKDLESQAHRKLRVTCMLITCLSVYSSGSQTCCAQGAPRQRASTPVFISVQNNLYDMFYHS